jgi:hypothetical protein
MKAPVQEIQLTKIKQWYIPANTESYIALRKAGVPLLRIHQDFIPTLGLLVKNKIRAKEVNFKTSILDPFLDKVGSSWLRKDNRRCDIQATSMRFDAVKPESFAEATETVPKLQAVLEKFFTRWGYGFTFELSSVKTRMRLNVNYWLDSEKLPVIELEQDPEELTPIRLKLGFTRLTFTFDGYKSTTVSAPPVYGSPERGKSHKIGYVHLLIEVSQGGIYKPLHSTRCTYTELSTVKPLIAALMSIPNFDHHNFDNPAE